MHPHIPVYLKTVQTAHSAIIIFCLYFIFRRDTRAVYQQGVQKGALPCPRTRQLWEIFKQKSTFNVGIFLRYGGGLVFWNGNVNYIIIYASSIKSTNQVSAVRTKCVLVHIDPSALVYGTFHRNVYFWR